MHSIEAVRDYLEKEIGESKLMKIYPLLLDLGDDIFKRYDSGIVEQKL
jgi:hypothetical protein